MSDLVTALPPHAALLCSSETSALRIQHEYMISFAQQEIKRMLSFVEVGGLRSVELKAGHRKLGWKDRR